MSYELMQYFPPSFDCDKTLLTIVSQTPTLIFSPPASTLETLKSETNSTIEALESDLAIKTKRISELETKLEDGKRVRSASVTREKEKLKELESVATENKELKSTITKLQAELVDKSAHIEKMNQKQRELETKFEKLKNERDVAKNKVLEKVLFSTQTHSQPAGKRKWCILKTV
jgi:chromosome segregation ATPase